MSDLSWRFEGKERMYIDEVLLSGFGSSTSGNMNTRLENAFAKRFGRNYGITFNSGTTTLHAALRACGVGYGDEVILPALTVISCMNAVLYCNAVPVFADINDDYLIDCDSIESKITEHTKAIMPVHLYGAVCDMTRIMQIAEKYNLKVIEDCAQCYLGTHNNKLAGTFGDVASWSFENSKHISTGDGGIILCDDETLGDTIRKLNTQGYKNATAESGKIRTSKSEWQKDPNYQRHSILGYMYRLPEVCAAIGLAQLEKLSLFVSNRCSMALKYNDVLKTINCDWLKPQTSIGNSYYTFACLYDDKHVTREQFYEKYTENGGDGIYAAWVPLYREGSVQDCKDFLIEIGLGDRCCTFDERLENTERLQPYIMQFTTNQKNNKEMDMQQEAFYRTIRYFMY